MVQTRAQSGKGAHPPAPEPVTASKRKAQTTEKKKETKAEAAEPEREQKAAKKEVQDEKQHQHQQHEEDKKSEQPAEKPNKKESGEVPTEKIREIISKHGSLPFQDSKLAEPNKPTAETVLAHIIDALLKATRISHHKADETMTHLLEEGFQDVKKLHATTWDERCDILQSGGYAHYKEKTSTQLGDLAEWIITKYDGDLNNLLKDSGPSRTAVEHALKEIKGFGDVAIEIFFTSIQYLWTDIAPWIGPRNMDTAHSVGIKTDDVDAIYAAVDKDPAEMCKLARALSEIRLEKDEAEYQ